MAQYGDRFRRYRRGKRSDWGWDHDLADADEPWHNGRITPIRPSLFTLALIASIASGCELSLEGRPCPCSNGYECCYNEGICRKEGTCAAPSLDGGVVPRIVTAVDQSVPADTLVGNSITAFGSISDTELWVGTECSGLFTLRGPWKEAKIDRRYYAHQGSVFPDNAIRALHVDPRGTLWAITRYGYVYAFDGQSWTIFGSPGFIKANGIGESRNVLAFSPDGSVWLLRGSLGVLWQMVDGVLIGPGIDAPRNVDQNTRTNAIAFDGNGVLFAATNRGPAILQGRQLVATGPDALKTVAVNDLSYSKEWGRMLFATDAGLWSLDNANQWSELELSSGVAAVPKPTHGTPVRTISSASGRVVAILSRNAGADAVALGRNLKMEQINFDPTKIHAVGFLPDPMNGALALLARRYGAPRVESTYETGWLLYEKLLQSSEAQRPWQVDNLAALKRREGDPTSIADIVANPKAYSGRFVTVQARNLDEQDRGYKFVDEFGNKFPGNVHQAFSRFVTDRRTKLGMPVLGMSNTRFVFSGYFEEGVCYDDSAPYFFFVTDYYPAEWSKARADDLYKQLDALCTNSETACCCEWTKPLNSDYDNPLACPNNPACKN